MEWLVRTPYSFIAGLLALSILSATGGALAAHVNHELALRERAAHVGLVGISTTLALGPAGYAVGVLAEQSGFGYRFVISPDGIALTDGDSSMYHSITANVFQSVYGDWFE